MRGFGAVLFLAGAIGVLAASQRLEPAGPASQGLTVEEQERYELLRYGAATAAVAGLILALFPKGR